MDIYADGGRIVMQMTIDEAEDWLPDFEGGIYRDQEVASGLRYAIEKAKHNAAFPDIARIRRELLAEVSRSYESLFTGTNFDATMVQAVPVEALTTALNRIIPEEE